MERFRRLSTPTYGVLIGCYFRLFAVINLTINVCLRLYRLMIVVSLSLHLLPILAQETLQSDRVEKKRNL